jgi:hypothetical protein
MMNVLEADNHHEPEVVEIHNEMLMAHYMQDVERMDRIVAEDLVPNSLDVVELLDVLNNVEERLHNVDLN